MNVISDSLPSFSTFLNVQPSAVRLTTNSNSCSAWRSAVAFVMLAVRASVSSRLWPARDKSSVTRTRSREPLAASFTIDLLFRFMVRIFVCDAADDLEHRRPAGVHHHRVDSPRSQFVHIADQALILAHHRVDRRACGHHREIGADPDDQPGSPQLDPVVDANPNVVLFPRRSDEDSGDDDVE